MIEKYCEKSKKDQFISIVYTVSNKYGLIPSLDYWNKHTSEKRQYYKIYSDDVSNYNIIRKDMFAYNPSRLNVGSIGCLFEQGEGLLSPMYCIFRIRNNKIIPAFLLILLKSSRIVNDIERYKEEGARFRFDFRNWSKIKIPLPPLSVQQEIVRILDRFHSLCHDLTCGLPAEIAARKKQYEYYRDKLLSFKEKI